MDGELPPLKQASAGDAQDRSLADDLRMLAEEARTMTETELAFQKARASLVGGSVKGIVVPAVVALVLVFFALMALTFGLVLSLASLLGPWLATVAAVLILLGVAALCGLLARRRWMELRGVLKDDGAADD